MGTLNRSNDEANGGGADTSSCSWESIRSRLKLMFSPIRRWETVRKDDGDAETHFEVFPESFRMCFTVYFICFFLLATLITTQFGAIDLDDNPIVNRFGYLNLSVMFSDPPFTYFAFTLWFPAQIMLLSFEVF